MAPHYFTRTCIDIVAVCIIFMYISSSGVPRGAQAACSNLHTRVKRDEYTSNKPLTAPIRAYGRAHGHFVRPQPTTIPTVNAASPHSQPHALV